MPGYPKRTAFNVFVAENELEDEIFERIASGESPERLSKALGTSRRMLYHWLERDETGERRKRWDAAMKASAEAHVERSHNLLRKTVRKGSAVTAPHVTAVNSLVNFERWLAGVKNPEKYGEKTAGVSVNVNLGALHLDALRQAGSMAQDRAIGPVVDAELVEDGS